MSQVLAKYDVVLVDQYGVLHNGTQPMIGAVDCFKPHDRSREASVLVSNTANHPPGYRPSLGVTAETCVMNTSRDDAAHTHAARSGREIVGLDKAQFLVVEGVQQVCYSDCVAEALATDYRHTNTPNDAINEFLRGAPAVVSELGRCGCCGERPLRVHGRRHRQAYEEKGGEVVYFGKPTKEHFEVCLQLANVTDKSKVVHIGDSLHHDIQGATNVGVDSILIAGGVHAKQLEVDAWSDAEEDPTLNQSCWTNY
ncbi:HAD-like domain [Phytophthora cactorum]|nr:HAD-like domain [Phytophthora cactorum]